MTDQKSAMNHKTLLLIFGVWIAVVLLYLISVSLDAGTTDVIDWPLFKSSMVDLVFWSGFSILLYHLLKAPIIDQNIRQLVMIFIVTYLIWQPLLLIFNGTNLPFFKSEPIPSVAEIFAQTPYRYIYFNFFQYSFAFSFCSGLMYYRHTHQINIERLALQKKNAETELRFADLKMQALQSQLSPHFLFNSLNSISGLIRTSERQSALNAIADVGDLLRFSLTASKLNLISIQEEIDFTQRYVSLQRLRFRGCFTFQLHCPDDLLDQQCPPFILQTLIENVFTHAVFDETSPINIELSIESSEEQIIIRCRNTIYTGTNEHQGMGLALNNLTDRLNILYDNRCLMQSSIVDQHFLMVVGIPTSE